MAKIDVSSSHLRATDALLGLIIFFSATQLGLHFWPISALVYGVRIDYLSPTLYFLDLLILLYLLLTKPPTPKIVGILLPTLFINLIFSINPLASLSWSLHLVLYCYLIFSLRRATMQRVVPSALIIAFLFQVILATIQVFYGHSFGGWLYWVGERMVAVGAPGVATSSFMGGVVLRAYATFGHPNVLAGWLVICLLILLKLKSNVYRLTSVTALAILGVLLAQSRAAALSLFGLTIPFYLIKQIKFRMIYLAILLTSGIYLLSTGVFIRGSDLSLTDRLKLQSVSWRAVIQYPFFGTGANASISTYPTIAPTFRLLQPDHDSPTLFLSWFGLFGIAGLLSLLTSNVLRLTSLLPILPILPILLLDHYLLTSPQGLFLLLLYLKCCEK